MTIMKQIHNGLKTMKENPIKLVVVIIFETLLAFLFSYKSMLVSKAVSCFPSVQRFLCTVVYLFLSVAGGIYLFIQMGMPLDFLFLRKKFRQIGLKNRLDQVPVLVSYSKDVKDRNLRIYIFSSEGIPLSEWEKSRDKIENILNIIILDMSYADDNQNIVVKAVPAKGALPEKIDWTDTYLDQKEFVIVLGQGISGLIKIDLTSINSILIGGSTGSGKTIELKSILLQALQKKGLVYLADFKGGIDFTADIWQRGTIFLTDKKAVIKALDDLLATMEERKELLLKAGVANIKAYNALGCPINHIFFACDEVAELLDTTGLNKEEKAEVQAIISKLSSLARLGRAFGIHLVLATQRPDANIIPGQIKNNIDCRICGRADQILSMIILDNTGAVDKIGKSQQGRFILPDGTIFQGYWLDETKIETGR